MRNYADILDAYDKGRYHIAPYRKASPSFVAGNFTDLSYSAGTPIANYYASAPMVFTTLNGNEGIFKGVGVDKLLHKITIHDNSANATFYNLLDYVLYAPFVDFDSTDEQFFTTMPLPRYDGKGLKVMLVIQGTGTATANITMNYTNENGVSGRTSITSINSLLNAGTLASQGQQGYLNLMQSDNGVKSIESVTMSSAIGGIGAIVIVKPLASIQKYELSPIEKDFLIDKQSLPFIHKDAYLNFVAKSVGSATVVTQGQLEFIY